MSDRAVDSTSRGEGRGVFDDDYRPDDLTDWDYVRETLRLIVRRDGIPTQLDDLRVDEFTEARLRRSDYSAVIKIWQKPTGADFHPAIERVINDALAGRDPEVHLDEGLLTIYANVADDSFDTRADIEFFGLRLALILDGLPRVVVGRYRNFGLEDQRKN